MMRKTFELENLDCAHCAAKMEHDINELPEVKKCSITFMTSRMTLSVNDDAELNTVLDRAQEIMKSYEKDCTIVR